jgi:HK97 family phage major capsid protein/HK97 family phage prohead protease
MTTNRKDAAPKGRAYSLLTIKAMDDDARTISGIATTPTPDRVGDIVDPLGAKFANPLPLLWQHDSSQPIGEATFGRPTKNGIPFTAKFADVAEPASLKDRLDTAWASVKARLVKGVSIGFRGLEYSFMESGGIRYTETEILELSIVTIPANVDATIQTIKSYDRAAKGKSVVRISQPGASGKSPEPKPLEGKQMNVQDQIKSFETERTAKAADVAALLEKCEGASFDTEQKEQYDTLTSDIDSIDTHLKDLKKAQSILGATAAPVKSVDPGQGGEAAAAAAITSRRASDIIVVEKKLEKGIRFARFAGALANCKGNLNDAASFVKSKFPEDRGLPTMFKMYQELDQETICKAAVAAGTTGDATWAGPLVQYRDMVEDFIEYLRPMTIVGKLPLKRVPFNIRIPRQTTGGAASWVGENKAKPVTNLAFDNVTMKWFKLATIAVITQELARFSSPAAEGLIRDALAEAIAQQMDADFIDPDNAGVTDVMPASILNGVTAVAASGTNEAALRTDIASVFAPFIAANMSPTTGYWVMTPSQALKISLMVNALGQPAFPGVTLNGGTFWGMPVIVSQTLATIADSTGDGIIALVDASSILLADDGQATIDVSTQASVQMSSTPDNPETAATVLRSLWQDNLIGIRAERFVNWLKARPQAAQYIHGANYH